MCGNFDPVHIAAFPSTEKMSLCMAMGKMLNVNTQTDYSRQWWFILNILWKAII